MKIAVSSSGKDLESQIDPRFGRCAFFVIVETDDMSFEAFDNEGIALGGGAGIQAAQFVASKGARAIVTGNIGPNAVQTLSAAGLEVFLGQSGSIREVLEKYKTGTIDSTSSPNVADHYGMGSGAGLGRGMGMGRGGGMGMGRGMNSSTWNISGQSGATMLSKEERLKRLKDQANELRQQIEDLESSMEALEEK